MGKKYPLMTYMPCNSYVASAKVLDDMTLRLQRANGIRLLNILLGNSDSKWKYHPIVSMWRSHEWELIKYIRAMCNEHVERGNMDNFYKLTIEIMKRYFAKCDFKEDKLAHQKEGQPWWMGWAPVHLGHKSALLRKLPEHYNKYMWEVGPMLPLIWPDPVKRTGVILKQDALVSPAVSDYLQIPESYRARTLPLVCPD